MSVDLNGPIQKSNWTMLLISYLGIYFFGFLLKVIYFQNLGYLSFFTFFMIYYKLFTK